MKRILLIAALILPVAAPLAAQGLPSLGKASEITVGTLPDGITYYLVHNDSSPGYADFAIVQPSRSDRVGPRNDLSRLAHFRGRKPYRFLANAGVGYPSRGFIQHLRNATVMRFPGVPVGESAVYDSTLLMMMDIALGSDYRQAMVISGDVNVSAVLDRIRTLSMTVPMRVEDPNPFSYTWRSQDSTVITTAEGPVGLLRVTYRSPRTEPELMNTIQPVMSKVLASEFDIVLRQRLRAAFTAAGLPLADCRYRYTGSSETAGDEMFTLTVETAPERLYDAVRIVAGVLSTLDDKGVTADELTFARSVVSQASARDAGNTRLSNAEYVDKCVAAYLYGSNLASASTLNDLFNGRRLDPGRERELLSRYISATLSSNRNLHIHARSTVKPDAEHIRALFARGWEEGCTTQADIPTQADTLLIKAPHKKVKLRNTASDSFSGGTMWTFSNGVSVIFKKTSDKGAFHYGYMVRGGWTEISGITGAESAFASDVAALRTVATMSPERWDNLLAMNGITLKREVLLSDVRYTGTAPSGCLSLVLKALVAMAIDSEPDAAAYDRYRQEKAIRILRDRYTAQGTRAVLDSTMSPGYIYAAGSMPALPDATFPTRVGDFLRQKGLNSHNTVIVLAGDLNEASVLKHLNQVLGAFPTGQQRITRPRHAYPIRKCWTTTAVKGTWHDKGVTMAMSAPWPFSAEGTTVLSLACATLEGELAKSLANKGYTCYVSADASLLPAEKITLYINCYPVPVSGLPTGVELASNASTLNAVREAVNRLAREEVSPAVLERAKTKVRSSFTAQGQNTAWLRDLILYRNSLGREIGGAWQNRVNAATAADVQAVFTALEPCKTEFIVQ
ncbi:MAG: hypothetical protein IKZ91_04540 [Bacteroidales bacterium]|nr:hypothetical protein [Bacteroidales bacterium]